MTKHARIAPAAIAALAAVTFALGSCREISLEARSRVTYPRVLAIVAEPPEARPGELVALRAFVGGASPRTTYRWLVCTRPEATTTFTASSSFGTNEPDNGCFGDASVGVIEIGRSREAFFAIPPDWLSQVDRLRAVYGTSLSAATLRRLAQTVGLVVTFALEISDPDTDAGIGNPTRPFRAIKRVIIADRAMTNQNPPAPAFDIRFGAPDAGADFRLDSGVTRVVHMAREPGDPDHCIPWPTTQGVSSVTVQRGERVILAPEQGPEPNWQPPWLEAYDAYDSSGMLQHLVESDFYSFYSNAGFFTSDRTRAPTRATIWVAPNARGHFTLWIFVRDGRGGASGCSFELDVP